MMHLSIHFLISVGFYVCFLLDLLNSVFILFNHSLAKQFSCGLPRLGNEDWDKLKLGKKCGYFVKQRQLTSLLEHLLLPTH